MLTRNTYQVVASGFAWGKSMLSGVQQSVRGTRCCWKHQPLMKQGCLSRDLELCLRVRDSLELHHRNLKKQQWNKWIGICIVSSEVNPLTSTHWTWTGMILVACRRRCCECSETGIWKRWRCKFHEFHSANCVPVKWSNPLKYPPQVLLLNCVSDALHPVHNKACFLVLGYRTKYFLQAQGLASIWSFSN